MDSSLWGQLPNHLVIMIIRMRREIILDEHQQRLSGALGDLNTLRTLTEGYKEGQYQKGQYGEIAMRPREGDRPPLMFVETLKIACATDSDDLDRFLKGEQDYPIDSRCIPITMFKPMYFKTPENTQLTLREKSAYRHSWGTGKDTTKNSANKMSAMMEFMMAMGETWERRDRQFQMTDLVKE